MIEYAGLGGFVLDCLFGDPAWLPHPVVYMGTAISALEKRLRAALPKTPQGELAGGCIVSHNIRVFGLGESSMEHILHDMMEKRKNPTIAPYAKTSECFARVTAKADTTEECEKLLEPVVREIVELLGNDVYGVDVDSLEQVVGDGLRAKGLKLAVAESCTGGLLSKRITDIPGCSDYYQGGVCSYANEVKKNVLGVW